MTSLTRIVARLTLPSPPPRYDPRDQAELRRTLEAAVSGLVEASRQTQGAVEETQGAVDDLGSSVEGLGFDYMGEVVAETALVGVLTLVPLGPAFDTVESNTKSGNAPESGWSPLSPDGSGNYVDSVALVEKHLSTIAYRVSKGGQVVQQSVVGFDVGTVANVLSLSHTEDGAGTSSVTANVDSDADEGLGGVQYRVDGGAWNDAVVGPGRTAVFDVAQLTTGPQDVEVRALSTAGDETTAGPIRSVEVPKFVETPPATPMIVSVTAVVVAAGADDQFVVSTSIQSASGSTHALHIELYTGGSLVYTEPAHNPDSGALIHLEPAAAAGALYYARVRLFRLSDHAVVSEVTTIPAARS